MRQWNSLTDPQCFLKTPEDEPLRDVIKLHLSDDPEKPTSSVIALSYSVDVNGPLDAHACPDVGARPASLARTFDTELRLLIPDVPSQCVMREGDC